MIFVYILLSLIFLVILFLVIPVRLKIKYKVSTDFTKKQSEEQMHTLNYIEIYIFYFIKIKKIELKNKQNTGKSKKVLGAIYKFLLDYINFKKIDEAIIKKDELKKITGNIYIEKLNLDIGINLQNILANVYIIAILNALINMYFAKNSDNINFKKTSYQTYISNKILNINLDSIIRFKFVNTITIIIIIMRFRKAVKKDGKTTSNRKFNDDSYDFT